MSASSATSPGREGENAPEQSDLRALRLRYRRLVHGIERKLNSGVPTSAEEMNFARSLIRCETKILRREPTLSSLDLLDRIFEMLVTAEAGETVDSRDPLSAAILEHLRCARSMLEQPGT